MRMFSFKYQDGLTGVIFTDYAFNWPEMQKEHPGLEKAECIAEITTDLREFDVPTNQILLSIPTETEEGIENYRDLRNILLDKYKINDSITA